MASIPHETFQRLIIGQDIVGFRPSNFLIVGIRVDNPSGSWLKLAVAGVQLPNDLVPPYTMGWQLDIPYPSPDVTVLWVEGPAGQRSTNDGENGTLWVYDRPIGTSPGSSFVTRGEQPEWGSFTVTDASAPPDASITTTLVTGTTQRLRIYACFMRPHPIGTRLVDRIYGQVVGDVLVTAMEVTPNRNVDFKLLPVPYDNPPGVEVTLQMFADPTSPDRASIGFIFGRL